MVDTFSGPKGFGAGSTRPSFDRASPMPQVGTRGTELEVAEAQADPLRSGGRVSSPVFPSPRCSHQPQPSVVHPASHHTLSSEKSTNAIRSRARADRRQSVRLFMRPGGVVTHDPVGRGPIRCPPGAARIWGGAPSGGRSRRAPFQPLRCGTDEVLRAYPRTPAAFHVMMEQAKWIMA